MGKNAIVVTNGCPENRLDCAETEQLLVQNDWKIISKVDKADLIILNLCGLVNACEENSLNLIKKAKKNKKNNAKILVTGCLPKINSKSIKEVFEGDLVKGHNNIKISKLLGFKDHFNSISANYLIPESLIPISIISKFRKKLNIINISEKIKNGIDLYSILNRLNNHKYRKLSSKINLVQPNTYYIKVSSGCMHACSYCAVKLSRGSVKSKPVDTIIYEFLRGLKAGFSKFSLIGTDLGSYGKDIHTDLTILLKELVSIDGEYNIKLRNVHPQFLIEKKSDLCKIMETGKISHITTAIQHGNDRLLEYMKRFYKINDCLDAINSLKNAYPKLAIRTQLIVGFPGETESDFNDTLNLIDKRNADFFEVHSFSPRIGTLADRMVPKVPKKIINQRHYIAVKQVCKAIGGRPHNRTLSTMQPDCVNKLQTGVI